MTSCSIIVPTPATQVPHHYRRVHQGRISHRRRWSHSLRPRHRGAIPPDQHAAPRRSCAAIMGRGSARESRREINWLANGLGVGERLEAIDLAHVDLAEASNPLIAAGSSGRQHGQPPSPTTPCRSKAHFCDGHHIAKASSALPWQPSMNLWLEGRRQ